MVSKDRAYMGEPKKAGLPGGTDRLNYSMNPFKTTTGL
jgi:hypothetical protein